MKESRKKWKDGEFLARVAELRGAREVAGDAVDVRQRAKAEVEKGQTREATALWQEVALGHPEPWVVLAEAIDQLLPTAPRDVRVLAHGDLQPTTRLGAEIRGLALAAAGSPNEGEDALIESLNYEPFDMQAALLAARAAAYVDRDVAETFLGEIATRKIGPKEREIVYSMLDDLAQPTPTAKTRRSGADEAWLVQALAYSDEGSAETPLSAPMVADGPSPQPEMDRTRSINALMRHLESDPDEAAVSQGSKEIGRRYLRWNPAGRWEKTRIRENPKTKPGVHAMDNVPMLELQVILQDCKEPASLIIYLSYQASRRVSRLIDRRTSPAELVEMLRDMDLPVFVEPVDEEQKLIAKIELPDLWASHARSHPGDSVLVLTWSSARAELLPEQHQGP